MPSPPGRRLDAARGFVARLLIVAPGRGLAADRQRLDALDDRAKRVDIAVEPAHLVIGEDACEAWRAGRALVSPAVPARPGYHRGEGRLDGLPPASAPPRTTVQEGNIMHHMWSPPDAARSIAAAIVTLRGAAVAVGLAVIAHAASALAQTAQDPALDVEQVASGLDRPTAMAFIGPSDMLVLEKASGQVRRVTGGVLQPGFVLDVGVDGASERGLLGIALHPGFPVQPFAYLYFTQSGTGGDTNGSPAPLGNRLYRYTWNGSALVSPVLIAAL